MAVELPGDYSTSPSAGKRDVKRDAKKTKGVLVWLTKTTYRSAEERESLMLYYQKLHLLYP